MTTPIRWGILGAGQVAAQFAAGLGLAPGARLAAVASRTRGPAAALAATAGARVLASCEELAAAPDVDVVYVVTPPALHRAHVLTLLDAGKAVVCEKPFATSAAEARELVERSRARGVFCMEGMWMRFTPAARALRALVDAGGIGAPQALSASLGLPLDLPAGDRRLDPAQGGGALLDLGVYPISLAVWLLGRPARVAADAVRGPTGVDLQVEAVLGFDGGRQAVVGASYRSRLTNGADLSGATGLARLHAPLYCPEALTVLPAPPLAAGRGGGGTGGGRLGQLLPAPAVRALKRLRARLRADRREHPPLGNGFAHEAIEAMRCLRAGERESPLMPLEESVTVLETVDRIRAACARAEPN